MRKVLHVASFNGNIGDNANHNGLRHLIRTYGSDQPVAYTELEIRKSYMNYAGDDRWTFDEHFAELANAHDAVIIGGGGFFEIWIEQSQTGTTIDMSLDILRKIRTPMLFFGLGFDVHRGIPEGNIDKFRRFIDAVYETGIHTITVRNDGSIKHIGSLLGKQYLERITSIPDGGFFLQIATPVETLLNHRRHYIAVNLAKDMLDVRFAGIQGHIAYGDFLELFAGTLMRFMETHAAFEVVFVPHIYSDLEAISDLVARLPDGFRRNRMSVAPLLHGAGAEAFGFGIYRHAELVMGMRLHANICAIGMQVPTIGICTYQKVADMYEDVGLESRVLQVNQYGFEKRLGQMMEESLRNRDMLRARYAEVKERMTERARHFFEAMELFEIRSKKGES